MKTKIFTLLVALTALFGIDKIQAQNSGDYRGLAASTTVSTPTSAGTYTVTPSSTTLTTTSISKVNVTNGGSGYSGTAVCNVYGPTKGNVTFPAIIIDGVITSIDKSCVLAGANSGFDGTVTNSAVIYPLILGSANAIGTSTITAINIANAGQGYNGAYIKVTGSTSGLVVFATNLNATGGILSADLTKIIAGKNEGFAGDLTAEILACSDIGSTSNWEMFDGTSWVQPTNLPKYTLLNADRSASQQGNNVLIPFGVSMFGSSTCVLYGEKLTVNGFVTVPAVQVIGAENSVLNISNGAGLFVTSSFQTTNANISGRLSSSATSSVIKWTAGSYGYDLYPATIINNGDISGFSLELATNCSKLTITGTPSVTPTFTGFRASGSQPLVTGVGLIESEIIIDQDIQLKGLSTTVLAVLSLDNSTPYSTNGATKARTLTINEGKKVTLDANSVFHYKKGYTPYSKGTSGGNATLFTSLEPWTYNINGTLDVSAGAVNLCTNIKDGIYTTNVASNILTLNVGATGKLICGDYVRVHQGYTGGGQIFINNNGIIEYAGSSLTTSTCTSGGTQYTTQNYGTSSTEVLNSLISTTDKNVTFKNPTILAGTSPLTINGNLNLNGTLSLGSNNLVIGSAGSIANPSSTNFIVTNGTGILKQSVAANTEKLFPVGASTGSFDPVTVKPTVATDFSVKVGTVLSGTPESSKVQYNAKEWDLTPTTPSSTVVSLTPSVVSVTGPYPIFGHYVTDKYENKLATLTGNTYTTTVSSFSPYVTGSSDVATAVENATQNGINVYSNNGQLFVTNINVGDEINVFAMNGTKVKSIVANNNSVVFAMNAGVYLLDVKSISNSAHTRIKTAVK